MKRTDALGNSNSLSSLRCYSVGKRRTVWRFTRKLRNSARGGSILIQHLSHTPCPARTCGTRLCTRSVQRPQSRRSKGCSAWGRDCGRLEELLICCNMEEGKNGRSQHDSKRHQLELSYYPSDLQQQVCIVLFASGQ